MQIAQFLWIGPKLSQMEQMCFASFLKAGFAVHLYTYGPVEGVPEGVTVKPGSDILPESAIFKYPHNGGETLAVFSDQFRLHLLYEKGGWWFDSDFLAIKPIFQPTELLVASTWEFEWGQCPVNSAIWCKPRDPHIRWMRDECDRMIASGKFGYGETGPFLLQKLIREQNLERHVAPWWMFCPIPWRMMNRVAFKGHRSWIKDAIRVARFCIWELYKPNFRGGFIRRGTLAVHWHNEVWKYSSLNKNEAYHPRSIYGRAQSRFLPQT